MAGADKRGGRPRPGSVHPCAPVRAFNTHGFREDESRWTLVKAAQEPIGIRDLVLDNGSTRVSFEVPGSEEQQASHHVYARVGESWEPVTSRTYGDYTYWVSTVSTPPHSMTITRFGEDAIEAAYAFEHYTDVGNLGRIGLVKKVALLRCIPGEMVRFESNPKNPSGEREVGIGTMLPIAFNDFVAAVFPHTGRTQGMASWMQQGAFWAAALEPGTQILRVLSTYRDPVIRVYQFAPDHMGMVNANVYEQGPDDGERYGAFVGAVRYDATNVILEAEKYLSGYGTLVVSHPRASGATFVHTNLGWTASYPIEVPETGVYDVWLRYFGIDTPVLPTLDGEPADPLVLPSTNNDFSLARLLKDVPLHAGVKHELTTRSHDGYLSHDALFVLPVGKARALAEDVRRALLTGEASPWPAGERPKNTPPQKRDK